MRSLSKAEQERRAAAVRETLPPIGIRAPVTAEQALSIVCQGSDTGGDAASRNPVPAVRSDSRSGPEGSSVNSRQRQAGELPQSEAAPRAAVEDVTSPGEQRATSTPMPADPIFADPVDTWICDGAGLRRWRPVTDRVDIVALPRHARLLVMTNGLRLKLAPDIALHLALLLLPDWLAQVVRQALVERNPVPAGDDA